MSTTTLKPRSMGSHHRPNRGKTSVWLTPPEIIKAVGPFDLDPCAPADQPFPTARETYTADGLSQVWNGTVWLNPPYGHPDQWAWVSKLAEFHGNGIALLFARTETDGFHRFCWQRARSMLFLRGRLHFHYPDGRRAKANAGAPSVLVAYGSECADRLFRCSLDGHYVNLGASRRTAAPTPAPQPVAPSPEPCPDCKGTGRDKGCACSSGLVVYSNCPSCNGTGVAPSPAPGAVPALAPDGEGQ